jgi:hypothetical protein
VHYSSCSKSPTRLKERGQAMIRPSIYPPEYDVIPQEIFWRPLSYFATSLRDHEDGLDIFRAASFVMDNEVSFDLRHYRGHPDHTATVYLSIHIEHLDDISNIIDFIVLKMAVPTHAIAWRRGWDFEFGTLQRREDDRLREPEARILALKIAAQRPDHTATTEYIKQQIPRYIPLSKADLLPSPSRRREARWQQIVGNVISHQETLAGPFEQGYAIHTEDGLSVTKHGLAYLNNMGFAV